MHQTLHFHTKDLKIFGRGTGFSADFPGWENAPFHTLPLKCPLIFTPASWLPYCPPIRCLTGSQCRLVQSCSQHYSYSLEHKYLYLHIYLGLLHNVNSHNNNSSRGLYGKKTSFREGKVREVHRPPPQ